MTIAAVVGLFLVGQAYAYVVSLGGPVYRISG
jgi:hypothetical protein